MSAKRSWDIQPNPRRSGAGKADTVIPWARPAAAVRGPALKERRRKARRRLLVLSSVLFIVIIGALIYGMWRPEVRIHETFIQATDTEALEPLVREALSGTYVGILPRDSIFLFSKEKIRHAILNAYPDIAAVSIFRTGFNSIRVKTIERVSAFDWCGASPGADVSCYQTDAEGFIFAPSVMTAPQDASSTPSVPLRIYAPLTASSTSDTPLRSYVENPSVIPSALKFERAMEQLSANVVSIQIRDDEADLHLEGGTRITYVLGKEEKAAQLAATAFPQLNLNDGSVEYIDLRFDGKVYFKKK